MKSVVRLVNLIFVLVLHFGFFLDGMDGGGSSIGGIVRMVVVMVALYWW